MLKKIASIFTGVTVICWLSGLAMLVPLPVHAVINEGDLIRGPDGIKVYIVNAYNYKRHIYNPDVFDMYGHFTWESIQEVDQATLDSYTTSDLYRVDVEHQVYSVGEDGIKHWLNMTAAEFVTEGYSWNQVFIVNATEGAYYTVGSELTPTVTPSAGLTLAIADDTPAATAVAQGAQDSVFTKVNFTAGTDADYTVTSIAVTRGGLSADADVSNIKLYDGTTKLGSTQALNTTTHKATFTGLSWTIPAGTTKVLTVKVSIASSGMTTGDLVSVGIKVASDVTASATPTGAFPIWGNNMTVAGLAVGTLTLSQPGSPSGSVIPGSTEQAVASFKFTSGGGTPEGFYLQSVGVTQVGSAVDSDLTNLMLKDGATQVGSTVASLVNGVATFTISDFEVLKSASKTLTLYADIASGIGVNRNVIFEITQAVDVTAFGVSTGGSVELAGTFPAQSNTISLSEGTLAVASDTEYVPSAQDYVIGQTNVLLNAYKFSANATEGARIEKIVFTLTGGTYTEISNIYLYDATTATITNNIVSGDPVAGPASAVGTTITFGAYTQGFADPGLFDVAKSGNRHILVVGDIPTGATNTNDIGVTLNTPQSKVWADGLTSQWDLATASITPANKVPSTDLDHDINANGTLVVTASGTSRAAATFAAGTDDFEFASFDFTAQMEDISLSSLTVSFSENAASTSYTAVGASVAADADVNNVRLYEGDTLLATDATVSSAEATFSLDYTIPRDTTKTLKIVANLPSSQTMTSGDDLTTWIYGATANLVSEEMTISGVYSGVSTASSITTSGDCHGNLMSKGDPAITGVMAATPAAKSVIVNGTDIHVGTLYLTASATEAVNITKIRISVDDDADADITDDDASPASADLKNMRLKVDGSEIKMVPTLTPGSSAADYATFSGLSLAVPKGGTKAVDIYVDVLTDSTSATPTYQFGIMAATTVHIAGSGATSGSALTDANITVAAGDSASETMTLAAKGSLAIAVASDTPVSAEVVTGATGVELAKWTFTPSDEAINLKKLIVSTTNSSVGYGTSVSAAHSANPTFDLYSGGASTTVASIDQNHQMLVYYDDVTGGTSDAIDISGYTGSIANISAVTVTEMAAAINEDLTTAAVSTSTTVFTITSGGTAGSGSLVIVVGDDTDTYDLANELKLGIANGGTESVGLVAGVDVNTSKVYLYKGTELVAEGYVGAGGTASQVTFDKTDTPVLLPVDEDTTLTLKTDIGGYLAAAEGSTLIARLTANTTNVVAEGVESKATIVTVGSGNKDGTAMYIYRTKPTVSLNASSPSGSQSPGTLKEVLRFDVAADAGADVTINGIEFNISTNLATNSKILGKTFKLYKATDLSTVLGSGASRTEAGIGSVTIFPTSGNVVGKGTTVTYVLMGDTSQMNEVTTAIDTLSVDILTDAFHWDDGQVTDANKKVLTLPVYGSTLNY